MIQNRFYVIAMACLVALGASSALAAEEKRPRWTDISDDKNLFDKRCDYKVWVLEDNKWRETWYLEAFDSENAFYTINRQSSTWSDQDDFYALNHKDKTKFLIGDNYLKVIPFSLCIHAE